MSSRLMLSVSGCRGVVGESLTPVVAARFAGCFAMELRERAGAGAPVRVVVGRDGRKGGEMVQRAAIAGLLAAGCDVTDLGVAMTPTVAVATDMAAQQAPAGTLTAGMVITASHNPQQWNGLKCLFAGRGPALFGSGACAPEPAIAEAIIARFSGGADPFRVAWSGVGTLREDHGATEAHCTRLMRALEAAGLCRIASALGHGLVAAVDSVNGSGAGGAKLCLASLGCARVEAMGDAPTGIFSHPPEPTLENLSAPGGLCELVPARGCDVGFAQDPDADRLALIDERGRYVGEEYTLALSALALLEASRRSGHTTRGALLVTNLSTSRMLDDVASQYGAHVHRTPVGEANVVAVMQGEQALLGGEGNGGTIWPRVCYVRDSLAAMALVLWLISPQGGGEGKKVPLSAWVERLPKYAIEKRKVDLARKEDAQPAIERVARAFGTQRVDRRDGAWIDFVDGPLAGRAWLHVRASNTEPIMRLICEAPTVELARGVLDQAARAMA